MPPFDALAYCLGATKKAGCKAGPSRSSPSGSVAGGGRTAPAETIVHADLDGMLVVPAAVVIFPLSYIFGDVLTEVYGYARARRVIWSGFAALIFAAVMASVVVALPHAPNWPNQAAYEIAFGNTWRIALASMFAYFCGEFVNSYVLAKMKIITAGKWLWTRTIGSTIFGEAVDSSLFYPLAFYGSGIIPNDKLPLVIFSHGAYSSGVGNLPLPQFWVTAYSPT